MTYANRQLRSFVCGTYRVSALGWQHAWARGCRYGDVADAGDGEDSEQMASECVRGRRFYLHRERPDKRPTAVSCADASAGRRGCHTDIDCEWLQRAGVGTPYTPRGPYRHLHAWRDCSCQSPAAHVTRYPHFPHRRPLLNTNHLPQQWSHRAMCVTGSSVPKFAWPIRGPHVPGTPAMPASATWHIGRNAECLPSWSLHVARPHVSTRPTTTGET